MASVSLEVYKDALNQDIVEGETCVYFSNIRGRQTFGVVVESRKKVKVGYSVNAVVYDPVIRNYRNTGETRENTEWVEAARVCMIKESMLYEILDGQTLMAMAKIKQEVQEEIEKVLKKKERAQKKLGKLPVGV